VLIVKVAVIYSSVPGAEAWARVGTQLRGIRQTGN
jgi:hypothetical protein